MKANSLTISAETLARMWRAGVLFLRSSVGGKAKAMAAGLLLLALCINAMNVLASYVGRYFMSAIERREMGNFIFYAWLYVGVFSVSTTFAAFFRFTEERLALLWRDWLTRRVIDTYMMQRVYLSFQAADAVSNPDQRIAEDVRTLTATTISFALMILNSTLTAVSFAGVLWGISSALFVVSVCYAALGSLFAILLGLPLVKLNYAQLDREAEFRAELLRVRENAQDIAEAHREGEVRDLLNSRVGPLVENLKRIIAVSRNLGFFTTGYNYLIQLVPILFVAPYFIQGGVEFGIISQSAMAFSAMVGAFSLIVTQFQSISGYISVVTRLNELAEAAVTYPP